MQETIQTGKKQKPSSLKKYLDYTAIVKNIPFILFLTVLAIIYIFNGHYSDKLVRKIAETEHNLKEQEYEYKNVKSKVIFRSKSSELMKAVVHMGLRELAEPPVFIKK
jgi:predicted membrane protein